MQVLLSENRIKISFMVFCLVSFFLSQNLMFVEVKKIFPDIIQILIFSLTLFNPSLAPTLFIFLFGIFQDVIFGSMVGTHSFIYLLIKYLVMFHRLKIFTFNFIFIWLGFTACYLISASFRLFISHFIEGKSINFSNVLISEILTVLIFPVAYIFIEKIMGYEKN